MISIIIPTYNSANCIRIAINSVLQQAYNDWEIIIVDDYSQDDTSIVVEKCLKDNNLEGHLAYYRHKSNKGVSASRNTGIKVSAGEFISFLDADDIWYPEKLEKVMCVFQKFPDIDLVCHNEYFSINGKRVKKGEYSKVMTKLELKDKVKVYKKLLSKNFLSCSAVTVRRACLENELFDENLHFGEDYDLWLRLSRKFQFYFLDAFLGEYRDMQTKSLSKDIKKVYPCRVQIFKKNIVYTGKLYFYKKKLFLRIKGILEAIKSKL